MNIIPTLDDWGDFESDLDTKAAYKVFFGKTNEEVQQDFYRCVLERADELRFMNGKIFQYYILGFRDFILSGDFQDFDDSDAASSYIKLIEFKLTNSPDDVLPIFSDIKQSLEYVASNQERFNASPDIYGDFTQKLINIKRTIHSLSGNIN